MPKMTTDWNHPDLGYGFDKEPTTQRKAYLVLSEEERAKGFLRPVRDAYIHTKCLTVTTMGAALAETYARQPDFYGATYCCFCKKHSPVSEFLWDGTEEVVGS